MSIETCTNLAQVGRKKKYFLKPALGGIFDGVYVYFKGLIKSQGLVVANIITRRWMKERLVAAVAAILLSFLLQSLNVSIAYIHTYVQLRGKEGGSKGVN